jgi:hypothetical protein
MKTLRRAHDPGTAFNCNTGKTVLVGGIAQAATEMNWISWQQWSRSFEHRKNAPDASWLCPHWRILALRHFTLGCSRSSLRAIEYGDGLEVAS